MEDARGEVVRDRRNGEGGDGVRTKAGGWFDLSHVCVQPHLFTDSWMSMKCWLPVPISRFCLGPGRCALSCSEFHDVLVFQAVWMSTASQVAILKVLHVYPYIFVVPSLGMGRWKA